MTIPFTKMQGLGNDYIYVDCTEQSVFKLLNSLNLNDLAHRLSDRHFGIGSDGLVLILPSNRADVAMRIFNADGSEAMMCGNAARCIGKYLYEHGKINNIDILLDTPSDIRHLHLHTKQGQVEQVSVDMGQANIKPLTLNVLGNIIKCTYVDIGNPHIVIESMSDLRTLDISHIGKAVEHHSLFPGGVNVEFVSVLNTHEISMRVWERGSGETMACGTGACAAAAATTDLLTSNTTILVHLRGGELIISRDTTTNTIWQTGEATEVFHGEMTLS